MSRTSTTGVLGRFAAPFDRWRRNESGVAAVEFALIAPVMMVLLFGVWEYSRIVAADRRVTKVSGSVANLVALATSPNNDSRAEISCGAISDILEITDVLLAPYDTTTISISIFNIRAKSDSQTDVEVKWSASKGAKAAAPTQYVANGKLLVDKKDDEVIVVVVNYEYPFLIDGFISGKSGTLGPYTLTETEPMKPRVGTITLTSTTGKNGVTCTQGS